MKQTYKVTGMGCSACQASVEKAVKAVPGIANVNVSLIENSMTVLYDETMVSEEIIISAVKKAGYGATIIGNVEDLADYNVGGSSKSLKSFLFNNSVGKRLLISLALLLPLVYLNLAGMLSLPHPLNLSPYLQMGLTLSLLIVNRDYFIKGFWSLVHFTPGMDTLVAMGASFTFVYSVYRMIINIVVSGRFLYTGWFNFNYAASSMGNAPKCMYFFEASGMIVTLITLGKSLESGSKARTMDAIRDLVSLAPETASIEKEGAEVSVNLSDVSIGDIVLIRMGERVPVDGSIVSGKGSFDKSALTGESVPKDLSEGMKVTAGSLCMDGFVRVRAEQIGDETTLSKVVELVRKAGADKAPIQRLADRLSGVFVPIVFTISVATLVAWLCAGYDFNFAFNMAISVIVISCPCALGLATPTAIMAGTGNAATHGIIIREASCLETARNVSCVLFDKTGTLTEGNMSVTDVFVAKDTDEKEFIYKAAVLETVSTHPYAKAVRMHALKTYTAFELMEERAFGAKTIEGGGISAIIGVRTWCAGNESLMKDRNIDISELSDVATKLKREGKTVIWFADRQLRGIMAVSDTVKAESVEAIASMKAQGLKLAMVTGDSRETAEAIADILGIDEVYSEILPADKHEIVDKLKARGEVVAMVGDGVNDAPALVAADVGISVGSGTDIAIDAADFVLMNNSISEVGYIINLSKRVIRIIRQNLFWAFIYNLFALPVAAGVFYNSLRLKLTPGISAGCMCLSSLIVVLNALRLNNKAKDTRS